MAEKEIQKRQRTRLLSDSMVQTIYASRPDIFGELVADKKLVAQRRRMTELLAGNNSLIILQSPRRLDASNPIIPTAAIGQTVSDRAQELQVYGPGARVLFMNARVSENEGVSFTVDRVINPNLQQAFFAIEGNELTLDRLKQERILLTTLSTATGIDEATILQLAEGIFKLRSGKKPVQSNGHFIARPVSAEDMKQIIQANSNIFSQAIHRSLIPQASDNEFTLFQISQDAHVPFGSVARRLPTILNNYLEEHHTPLEHVVTVRRSKKRGSTRVHYTRDFKEYMERWLTESKQEQRVTVESFSRQYGVGDAAILRALRQYQKLHPGEEIFQWKISGVGIPEREITPAARSYLESRYASRVKITKDDKRMNISEMKKKAGVNKESIIQALKKLFGDDYKKHGVLGIREGSTKNGIIYDEAIVAQVLKEVEVRLLKPEDNSMSINDLVHASGKGRTTINRIIASLPSQMRNQAFQGKREGKDRKSGTYYPEEVSAYILQIAATK